MLVARVVDIARAIAEMPPDLIAAVADDDHDVGDPAPPQRGHLMIEDRLCPHLEQALGQVVGQRTEPAPDAGGENDRLGDGHDRLLFQEREVD